MPAHDHLTSQGEHKPRFERAVPERREDGAVVVRCWYGEVVLETNVGAGLVTLISSVDATPVREEVRVLLNERELRTCIAALTAVLDQLVPDHPGNEREA